MNTDESAIQCKSWNFADAIYTIGVFLSSIPVPFPPEADIILHFGFIVPLLLKK